MGPSTGLFVMCSCVTARERERFFPRGSFLLSGVNLPPTLDQLREIYPRFTCRRLCGLG